ncbi:MAG: hypothetical protein KF716_18100 [Anaerolineae bacterium]|nr:hypothetical protein [Anaerolineae bacterium]
MLKTTTGTVRAVYSRPDGVAFVIGFYLLMGISFLLGVIFMITSVVSMAWYMAAGNHFYTSGLVMLLIMVAAGALVGAWMVMCALGLWANQPSSRSSTLVLSGLMTAVSLLSIPALKIAYADGSKLGASLILLAFGIAACNALVGWYLTRAEVKRYFETLD